MNRSPDLQVIVEVIQGAVRITSRGGGVSAVVSV